MKLKTILKLRPVFQALTPSRSLDDFYYFIVGFSSIDVEHIGNSDELELAEWLKSRHGVSGTYNSFGVITLICPTQENDLSFYFSELAIYLKKIKLAKSSRQKHPPKKSKAEIKRSLSLALDLVVRKPGLVGLQHYTATGFWYFLRGLEKHLEEFGLTLYFNDFERWLNWQYQSTHCYRWDRLLYTSIGFPERSFYLALDWFDAYRSARRNRSLKKPLRHVEMLKKGDLRILSNARIGSRLTSLIKF